MLRRRFRNGLHGALKALHGVGIQFYIFGFGAHLMSKGDQTSPQELYCELMVEIKERISIIRQFGVEDANPKHGLDHAYALEFCYLELRIICELIALASLVAHGDIPATKNPKLLKSYKPGAILDQMLRLHPEFYPRASVQILDEKGRLAGWRTASDPLTQEQLKTLWSECGGYLHRGTIMDLGNDKPPDFWRVVQWHNKIIRLLNVHMICLVDRKTAFHVVLWDERNNVVLTPMDRFVSPDGYEGFSTRG